MVAAASRSLRALFTLGLVAGALAGPGVAGFAQAAALKELTLPGPEGTQFVFCPVTVPGGSGPLAGQTYIMGSAEGKFRTPPTSVVVGGSFVNGKERYYYLGKFEVTIGQYRAVMSELPSSLQGKHENLPVSGITYLEAQTFIDRLNHYFYEHSLKSLPHGGTLPGFVRLPTEEEWEFAARGGAAVSAELFDRDYPYEGELGQYEWFSGAQSSRNKIQQVGRLKAGPLGLHDMLGNVAEMTGSWYRVEYYQGRSGGLVSCGGSYLTPAADMKATLRTEEPLYLKDKQGNMKANAKPTLGFRLALGGAIYPDSAALKEMEQAWETHRSGEGAEMPAALSLSDVSHQETVSAQEALKRLDKVQNTLHKNGLLKSVEGDLSAAAAALQNMAQIRRKADEDSARVLSKFSCERGAQLALNLMRIEALKQNPLGSTQNRLNDYELNVRDNTRDYGELLGELVKLPEETVTQGFDDWLGALQAKIDAQSKDNSEQGKRLLRDLKLQKAWAGITKIHYQKYALERRYDAASWQKDFKLQQ
ncbi:MAG: SUMF1/EgtB/PvdO family nonheme iron enzyme [Succinivibrio sp.]|nr:SUMF1/EgtB/PvdO family nonheme iron enzyme [Succinivibrio sp.]